MKIRLCKCGKTLSRFSKSGLCLPCFWEEKKKGTEGLHQMTGDKNGTVAVTRVTIQPIKTLDDVIRVCEVDTETYRVVRFKVNAWTTPKAENKGILQMHQVTAWLEPKKEVIDARAELAQLKKDALAHFKPRPKAPKKDGPKDYMLLLEINDLHVGKLAWGDETGHANYDTAIAIALFWKAVDTLLERVSGFTFKQVVLIFGNDLLNVDNRNNMTHAGTPQSTDSRFHKTFTRVRRMVTECIEYVRMETGAEVIALFVPGNHDTMSAWHVGDSAECFFHNTPGVTIDNAPTSRKYHEFGNTMLMFTHGDKGKRDDYPLLMATEKPEMFGRTKFREVHTGHLHQQRVTEKHGVLVLISRALCPPDAWHADHQFVGAKRSAEARVYHRREGHVSTSVFTVQE